MSFQAPYQIQAQTDLQTLWDTAQAELRDLRHKLHETQQEALQKQLALETALSSINDLKRYLGLEIAQRAGAARQ